MHELSIAQEIVEIVRDNLPKTSKKVKQVKVKVGALSGILPDSLKFCFETIVSETDLDGAKMEIINVPIKIKCSDCKKESIIDNHYFVCSNCKSINVEIIEGRELNLVEIEIED